MEDYIKALKVIQKIVCVAIECETIHKNPEVLAYMNAIGVIAEEPFIHYNKIDD